MSTLLIGYDVEHWDSKITQVFLQKVRQIHNDLNVPYTLFVVGETLEKNISEFQRIAQDKQIDIQQHTYSHLLLKTVVMESKNKVEIFKGGTLEQIREEVGKTNELLKKYLGVKCMGLTAPYGYYRGLSDRPDILQILHDLGIRFTRTYARNEKDYQPVSFEIQPFWYEVQGFPYILEFPIQGWQDLYLRRELGWKNKEGYLEEVKKSIEYIKERDLDWCYVQHDHSSIKEDPNMEMTRNFIQYALDKGVTFTSYKNYYNKKMKEK